MRTAFVHYIAFCGVYKKTQAWNTQPSLLLTASVDERNEGVLTVCRLVSCIGCFVKCMACRVNQKVGL